ncbi:four helix bundle protein [Candidatus Berkelbacteria bacterium]|nr:four helix bundle protein [Candidatus Berkelbacteria bacterium]
MSKSETIPKARNTKTTKLYDLEERTFLFAKRVRQCIKSLPKTQTNFEDVKQLTRSSGSVAANYIEANEALSKKDFLHRIKISRKEAKEITLWLKLIDVSADQDSIHQDILRESTELMKIFGAIISKSS